MYYIHIQTSIAEDSNCMLSSFQWHLQLNWNFHLNLSLYSKHQANILGLYLNLHLNIHTYFNYEDQHVFYFPGHFSKGNYPCFLSRHLYLPLAWVTMVRMEHPFRLTNLLVHVDSRFPPSSNSVKWQRTWALETDGLDVNPDFTNYQIWEPEQVL